jgi:hypothetical protein
VTVLCGIASYVDQDYTLPEAKLSDFSDSFSYTKYLFYYRNKMLKYNIMFQTYV